MKNTNERVMDFAGQSRRSALIMSIIYGSGAIGCLYFIAFDLPETIGKEGGAMWRVPLGIISEIILCWFAYHEYRKYLVAGEDLQSPNLITQQLKLIDIDHIVDGYESENYYVFSFENSIRIKINISWGDYKGGLTVGQVYYVRLLANSRMVFDIKTLNGELVEEDVTTLTMEL